jgi:plastocyanin
MKLVSLLSTTACLLLFSAIAFGQTGAITGSVKFAGAPPAQKPFAVPSAFPACGKERPLDRLVVGKDNGVANAVIYIEALKKKSAAATAPTIVADQKDCHYDPHVIVVTDGDAFTVQNSDATFHNVHGYFDADHSTAFNLAQPTKGLKMVQRVKKPGMYFLRCDIHPWMNAYVFVAGDGYATVSDADGRFTLSNVPPGTYKLVMWHEGWTSKVAAGRPTFSDAVQQTQQIIVTADKSTTADFTLK